MKKWGLCGGRVLPTFGCWNRVDFTRWQGYNFRSNVGPGGEFQGWLSKAAWPHAIWGSKYIKPPLSSDMNITGHIYIYIYQFIYIYINIYIYIYINYSYNYIYIYIQLWNDATDKIQWNSKKWSIATSFFSEALICSILIHSLGIWRVGLWTPKHW